MKTVTVEQMRELERRCLDEAGISGETLMERAGEGAAGCVAELCERRGWDRAGILLVAGRGNNGGDALVAARHLKARGHEVAVWLAGAVADVQGAARAHLLRLKTARVRLEQLPTREHWDRATAALSATGGPNVAVDGVLGTGLRGPARGPAAAAIRYLNALSARSLVVALDTPSGLDADTGLAAGDAVQADLTVTMGLPKRGLLASAAADRVGRLLTVDLGLPPEAVEKIEADVEFIAAEDAGRLLVRRPRAAHKGDFGHLLVLAGAAGYAGAAGLALRAALRSGVGLVSAAAPRGAAPVIAGAALEAMVHAAPETETGSLAAAAWDAWRERTTEFSAVLAGPGLTRHAETGALVERLLAECAAPLVLDADALNVCAGRLQAMQARRAPLVITPHPGELARLLGCAVAEVQADRLAAARTAAARTGAVVVLKGAGTVVAAAGRPLQVNLNGNPGLATGGSGDVLAGLLAGLLAQHRDPFDAARLAVFLHGAAGDEAAADRTEIALVAGDLVEALPGVLHQLTPR